MEAHKKWSSKSFLAVSVLSIASIVSFVALYPINQSAAYYLMPSRFWEMAVGCLAFIGFAKRVSIEETFKKVPPLLVLSLIILVMYLPREFAVISTIFIVFLTSILLASLKKGTRLFSIFTNPTVNYIGLISYSLYLWHWGLPGTRWTIGINKATRPPFARPNLRTSILSYELIEKKTRRFS